MPPSASATPPTQTTQRVPNFSSKPIFGADDGAGGEDETGTDVGGGGGGEGCCSGGASTGAATIGAGAGADCGVGSGTLLAAWPRSRTFSRSFSCRNRALSPIATT